MKLISALAVALGALTTRRVGAEPSCPAVKIIHATFAPVGSTRLRRLEVDNVCVTSRAEHITPFVDTGDDLVWQIRGEDLIEDNFERFPVDFVGHEAYWSTDGVAVPDGQKVLAITVEEVESFADMWPSIGQTTPTGVVCQDISLAGQDFAAALADRAIWLVVLTTDEVAANDVYASWMAWAASDGFMGSLEASGNCGTSGCLLAVGHNTGDLMTDVHTALQLVEHDSNPFASCVPQPYTTTTSTTSEPTSTTLLSTTLLSTTPLSTTPQPTQPPTTDATTSGGRATVAMATMLPSLIVSIVGIAAVLF